MVIGDQLIEFARAHFSNPVGVCDKRTSHGNYVKLVGFHTRNQIVDASNFGFAAAIGRNKFLSQTDAANADRWLASDFLDPSREIEIGAFEFGLPESTRAAVEDIDAGIRKRLNKLLEFFETRRETRGEVLLLPLRESEDDRIVVADFGANALHDVSRKTRALNKRTAVLIVALVRAFPKKVIDEIAVRTV